MYFRLFNLIILALLLSLFISCQSQVSEPENTTQQQITNSVQAGVSSDSMSHMEKRDGIPVLPMPGSKINTDKVDAVLEEGNVSYGSILKAMEKENIEKNIEKLDQLLQTERVQKDNELLFSIHNMLGGQYLRVYNTSKKKKYLDQAISHNNSAASIFKNQPAYKTDLASVYLDRVHLLLAQNKQAEAVSLMKKLIEEYQDIGYGHYKNWFPSFVIQALYDMPRRDSTNTIKSNDVVNYLKELTTKYNNEVGVTAQISLVKHYFKKGNQDKVEAISKSIEEKLLILDNPKFKKDKWTSFKSYLERKKSSNSQQK